MPKLVFHFYFSRWFQSKACMATHDAFPPSSLVGDCLLPEFSQKLLVIDAFWRSDEQNVTDTDVD